MHWKSDEFKPSDIWLRDGEKNGKNRWVLRKNYISPKSFHKYNPLYTSERLLGCFHFYYMAPLPRIKLPARDDDIFDARILPLHLFTLFLLSFYLFPTSIVPVYFFRGNVQLFLSLLRARLEILFICVEKSRYK